MEFILRDFLILLILTPWTVDGAGKVVVIYLYNTIYFICIILFNFIANITIAPSPVTAFLYQPAHFTCDGIEDVRYLHSYIHSGGYSSNNAIAQDEYIFPHLHCCDCHLNVSFTI